MYTVIAAFRDAQDGGHIYHPGDTFPRDGVAATPERFAELAGTANRTGRPLIRAAEEKKPVRANSNRRRVNA